MLYVNIFNITPDKKTIQVSLETIEGSNITSLRFWSNNTYNKDNGINLDYKLEQINNKEVFLITTDELGGIDIFSGIYFLQITTDATNSTCKTCKSPVITVTANFSNIQEYILNKVLELSICKGNILKSSECGNNPGMEVVNANLLLESLISALTFGFYDEAIDIYNSLVKMYSINEGTSCDNCNKLKNPIVHSGLGYGTLGNTLILT
jgi:hypothetical protein